MEQWVLILVMALPGQPPTMTSVQFGSADACRRAAEAVKAEYRSVAAQHYLQGAQLSQQLRPVWGVCAAYQ